MKVCIIGPGAMGSLFAALLSRSKTGVEVWLLDRDAERARKINAQGIIVEGASNFKQQVKATADANQIGPSDLVVIFTKSYDTDKALRSIKPLLSEQTNVLTLQNGLGNTQLISDVVGDDRTVGGVTAHGATSLDIGRVRHAGKGDTVIGKLSGKIFGDLRQVSSMFNDAGISTRITKDIDGAIWSKLVINAGINALASLCRLTNGALIEYEGAKEVLRQAVLEATKVAKRKRVKLLYDDSLQKVESVCVATADNYCSMLQDILHGRKTEVDFINGAIVRQGKSYGIKTPVNEVMAELIKTIESSYGRQIRL